MKKKNVKQALTNVLDIPQEIVLDVPKIVLNSNTGVWIENYKGIIAYDETTVKINTNQFIITILGQNLSIDSMTTEELTISGSIASLEYQ